MIAAELRTPALQPQEFAKAKQQFIGSLEASLPEHRGTRSRGVRPGGVPEATEPAPFDCRLLAAAKSGPSMKSRRSTPILWPGAHDAHRGGDLSPAGVEAEVAKAFSGWTGGQDYVRPRDLRSPLGRTRFRCRCLKRPAYRLYWARQPASSTGIPTRWRCGGHRHPGPRLHRAPDGDGAGQGSLTYNIGAAVSEDTIADGAWDISASFAPALLDKGLQRPGANFRNGGPTASPTANLRTASRD